MRKKIPVPVFDSESRREISERLEVDELRENCYRLVYTPGLIEGMAAGDEFEILEDSTGFKVLNRGGNLGVWCFFEAEDENKGTAANQLVKRSESIGGRLDGGGFTTLVFTFPLASGFQNIERLFNEATGEIPGSTWMYCNVYDPKDGITPLNWWMPK